MAATLADLEVQREKLRQALYSGTLSLQDASGRRITYHSIANLQRALSALEAQMQRVQGTGPVRQVRIHSSKGFEQ